MTADLTSHDAALKQHYTNDTVEDMTYANRPLYALLPKMENFGGKNLPIPIKYGRPQGRSKTFANAQARSLLTESQFTDYILTRAKDHSIATIDNETLEASEGDANAFIEAATSEIDGALDSLTDSITGNLYRDSSAYRAQVLAEPSETASTFTITIKEPGDITQFETKQMVVIYSAKSGGSIRTSDGSDDEWEIAAVNRNATTATLTLTGTYDSSGTIAADDYIFIEGDRGLGLAGLEDWLPSSAPSSTAFFGVDRSVDPTRLGGQRLDGTSAPLEEVLIEGTDIVGREGFNIDHYFMSFSKFTELKKSLGSKVQYVNLQANPRVSFQGVMIDGVKGPVKCIPDKDCPGNRVFGLEMKYWKLYSLGKAVKMWKTDGLKWLRQASADGVELRCVSYAQLGCRAPGSSINIQV